MIIEALEEASILPAMHRIICRIKIKHQTHRYMIERFDEGLHKMPGYGDRCLTTCPILKAA